MRHIFFRSKKMALKGQKFLKNCKVFDDLQKAIFDCDLVLASCGRIDVNKDSFFVSSEDIFGWTLSFKKINNLAIIFGREDRGLTNSELLLANKTFNSLFRFFLEDLFNSYKTIETA